MGIARAGWVCGAVWGLAWCWGLAGEPLAILDFSTLPGKENTAQIRLGADKTPDDETALEVWTDEEKPKFYPTVSFAFPQARFEGVKVLEVAFWVKAAYTGKLAIRATAKDPTAHLTNTANVAFGTGWTRAQATLTFRPDAPRSGTVQCPRIMVTNTKVGQKILLGPIAMTVIQGGAATGAASGEAAAPETSGTTLKRWTFAAADDAVRTRNGAAVAFAAAETPGGEAALAVTLPDPAGEFPGVLSLAAPIKLAEKRQMTVSFEARADGPVTGRILLAMGDTPYTYMSPAREIVLTGEWKRYAYSFTAERPGGKAMPERTALPQIIFDKAAPGTRILVGPVTVEGK